MRSRLILLALAALALGGCKTRFKCEARKCSHDPAPLAWAVAECRTKAQDAKCGSAYTAWMQCLWDHTTCDKQGRADAAALVGACGDEGQRYLRCTGVEESPSGLPGGHPPVGPK